jgi:hypothetical protein
MKSWIELWNAGLLFKDAFAEQRKAIQAVYGGAERILDDSQSPA